MDIEFELKGALFVWDARKAEDNEKHGVTFAESAHVFFDPFVRIVDASRKGEVRVAAIGYDAFQRLLFVVHVEREEDRIRIISARRAERHERLMYES